MKGFASGLGYGAGLTVGVCGGIAIVGATATAIFFGYYYVKKYFRDRKRAREAAEQVEVFADGEPHIINFSSGDLL